MISRARCCVLCEGHTRCMLTASDRAVRMANTSTAGRASAVRECMMSLRRAVSGSGWRPAATTVALCGWRYQHGAGKGDVLL